MTLHMDSWPWKIALVLAIIGVREFVRLLSPKDEVGATGENSRWLIETLDSAAIAIGLVLFIIQPFILQAFYIPSGSMENTLMGPPPGQTSGGDRLLVSKLLYRLRNPKFQEVVVFRAPPEAQGPSTPPGTDFIKRCIGTPGDVVYVLNGQLYRIAKGSTRIQKVNEPYTKWSPGGSVAYDMKIIGGAVFSREYDSPNNPGLWRVNGDWQPETEQEQITNARPEAVPANKYLMLGDHRNNSNDSHVWGFVPRENIVGKAIFVFWPPRRTSLVDRLSKLPNNQQIRTVEEKSRSASPRPVALPSRP